MVGAIVQHKERLDEHLSLLPAETLPQTADLKSFAEFAAVIRVECQAIALKKPTVAVLTRQLKAKRR